MLLLPETAQLNFEPTITLGSLLVVASVMSLVWKMHQLVRTWQGRAEQHDVLWAEYLENHGLDARLRPLHDPRT